MKENWEDILGYEGYYQVSDKGSVRSLDRVETYFNPIHGGLVSRNRKGRNLQQKVDRYGYCCVHLRKEGTSSHRSVHRLVATHFLENPENKPTVNHKDCNKKNNELANLEWATVQENTAHAYNNGLLKNPPPTPRRGQDHYLFKMDSQMRGRVLQLREKGRTYKQISTELGIGMSTACRVIKEGGNIE